MWNFENIPTVLYPNIRKAISIGDVNYLRAVTARYKVQSTKGCNCGSDFDVLQSYKAANNDKLFTLQVDRAT